MHRATLHLPSGKARNPGLTARDIKILRACDVDRGRGYISGHTSSQIARQTKLRNVEASCRRLAELGLLTGSGVPIWFVPTTAGLAVIQANELRKVA